jgi:hypothetical protein
VGGLAEVDFAVAVPQEAKADFAAAGIAVAGEEIVVVVGAVASTHLPC